MNTFYTKAQAMVLAVFSSVLYIGAMEQPLEKPVEVGGAKLFINNLINNSPTLLEVTLQNRKQEPFIQRYPVYPGKTLQFNNFVYPEQTKVVILAGYTGQEMKERPYTVLSYQPKSNKYFLTRTEEEKASAPQEVVSAQKMDIVLDKKAMVQLVPSVTPTPSKPASAVEKPAHAEGGKVFINNISNNSQIPVELSLDYKHREPYVYQSYPVKPGQTLVFRNYVYPEESKVQVLTNLEAPKPGQGGAFRGYWQLSLGTDLHTMKEMISFAGYGEGAGAAQRMPVKNVDIVIDRDAHAWLVPVQ